MSIKSKPIAARRQRNGAFENAVLKIAGRRAASAGPLESASPSSSISPSSQLKRAAKECTSPTLEIVERVHWTAEVESFLLQLCKAHNRIPPNGNKVSINWPEVVDSMNNRYPSGSFTTSNCKNKLRTLKQDFAKVDSMKQKSGMGGNENDRGDFCDASVRKELEDDDKRGMKLLENGFPHFNAMKELVGENYFKGSEITPVDQLLPRPIEKEIKSISRQSGEVEQTSRRILPQGSVIVDDEHYDADEHDEDYDEVEDDSSKGNDEEDHDDSDSDSIVDDGETKTNTPPLKRQKLPEESARQRVFAKKGAVWRKKTATKDDKFQRGMAAIQTQMATSLKDILAPVVQSVSPPQPAAHAIVETDPSQLTFSAVKYLTTSKFRGDYPHLFSKVINAFRTDSSYALILLAMDSENDKYTYLKDTFVVCN